MRHSYLLWLGAVGVSISFNVLATPSDSKSVDSLTPVTCTHLSPLDPNASGSPTNLIQLPNRGPGVSALAALMRSLFNELKAQKAALETSGELTPLTSFARAPCIWPTDLSTRTPKFDGFSSMMSSRIQAYNKKPAKNTYQGVIDGCLSCHRHYCSGPVPAIRGLRLSLTSSAPPTDTCEATEP